MATPWNEPCLRKLLANDACANCDVISVSSEMTLDDDGRECGPSSECHRIHDK